MLTPETAGFPVPLPGAGVSAGHAWPPERGREILGRLRTSELVFRTDLGGRHGLEEGSGATDGMLARAGPWCVKTSLRRRFADPEAGLAALQSLARKKTGLGDLLPPETALCLRTAPDGAAWLWTVCPWRTTLRGLLSAAVREGDEPTVTRALGMFAEAIGASARLARHRRLFLDVHPSNFVWGDGGPISYIDDDISEGRPITSLGYALLRRVEEYAAWPAAIGAYVSCLEGAILGLDREELRTTDLVDGIEEVPVRSVEAHAARERLAAAARRARRM